MKRISNELGKLNWGKRTSVVFLLWATTVLALPAQTLTTLHTFKGTDGATPFGGLVQATNGDLYGVTSAGGANGYGTIYKTTLSGGLKTLYSFTSQNYSTACGNVGLQCATVIFQATNGDLYGATPLGGTASYGSIFKMTLSGNLTTVYSFCTAGTYPNCPDGAEPSGLVQAANGDFYGTTFQGGTTGNGTVFKMTPSGKLTTLYNFCGGSCTPQTQGPVGLIQATNGDFYGATFYGGAINVGAVFKITPSGTFTTLHSFDLTDGGNLLEPLIQANNGVFYGTTAYGLGTIFTITPRGTFTTLHSFDGSDGRGLFTGPLVQATDGNFYGTAGQGGPNNDDGTIFKISASGTFTMLYNFCAETGCTDGIQPRTLIQATDGNFYGITANGGGSNQDGTIYRLSVGLGPFVETLPTSGNVGGNVKILGTDLTGATSVTFNGTPAVFTVVSASEITATVPTGATTGTVQVVTPGSGTLSSNVPFRVP
jgi:uncharacterized repeat protein (TIGR03803 family)